MLLRKKDDEVDVGDPAKPYKTDDALGNQYYADDAQEDEYRYGDEA